VGRLSGVGYYTQRLLSSLAGREGLQKIVVLSNRPITVADVPGLEVYRRGAFPVRSIWMQLLLPGILRELRPDLAHFTNYLAPMVAPVPYVVSVHDMSLTLVPEHHTLKKRLLTASLVPAVARKARLVLVPSESTRRDVTRLLGLPAERLRVIPYAPAPSFRPIAEAAGLDHLGLRQPYFLYVGTLEPRKNIARALRAFAGVVAECREHTFVIAGQRGWKCEDVFFEASRPELAGRVLFLDYVSEEDLPLLYSHATALVYPSLYEGFGFPVVEAMACGCPVLTSRTSSLGEIGSGAALLVDPENEEAMASGLRDLARDNSLRRDLSARGLTRASEFTWERVARETVAAYREALDLS